MFSQMPTKQRVFKLLFPLLRWIAQFYFWTISFIFGTINSKRPKRIVEVPSEETQPLLFISATEAARRIREGQLTARRLVQTYVDRIKEVNPQLNAVVHACYEEALEEAARVDRQLESLDRNSQEFNELVKKRPLLGVPFISKDNLMTKGLVCISGHPDRVNSKPCDKDAEVVRLLREAGAILLTVTNLPPYGGHWTSSNPVNGTTNNPYDLRRNPGGSSGGTSALIGAAASIFGLGNDLGGSIRNPAFFCGIFGLKPTPGTISLEGVVPELKGPAMETMCVNGPLCRYAEDLDLFYRAMVTDEKVIERLAMDQTVHLKSLQVYYMEDLNFLLMQPLHGEIRESVRRVAKHLEKRFSLHAHRVDFPVAHHTFEMFGSMVLEDREPESISACLQKFFKLLNKNYDETPLTASCKLFYALRLRNKEDREFIVEKRNQLHEQLCHLLNDNGILLFPSCSCLPLFQDHANFLPFDNAYTNLFNTLGLPSLQCPLGLNKDGLPLGVQVVGPPYSEARLIAVGKELERAFGGWTPPVH